MRLLVLWSCCAGKTSLLKIIAGVDKDYDGEASALAGM
jgi:ATPase subunit of ABC transporter with duplicated ATPase domains